MRDLYHHAFENSRILYTDIKQFYGGWRRRLLFLLVIVAFFSGRYAQNRRPNNLMLELGCFVLFGLWVELISRKTGDELYYSYSNPAE